MEISDTQKKWDAIYQKAAEGEYSAVRVLQENQHLLPKGGCALELACGMAANAAFLAQHGLCTTAWDISEVVIERLKASPAMKDLAITFEARDIVRQPPPAASFDVITVSYFLDRSLVPYIKRALKPLGLIFYQTFTQTYVNEGGPRSRDFRLADNELLQLFSDYQVLVYREEGCVGELQQGYRDEALIVAQKL
ncbi:MAG: class I SAM-dependent methyltransferase [Gammaproteobacteria bacterium]|nr:class I SAM-dependent methyltransferase [Gammaproteobacteria bacterium]